MNFHFKIFLVVLSACFAQQVHSSSWNSHYQSDIDRIFKEVTPEEKKEFVNIIKASEVTPDANEIRDLIQNSPKENALNNLKRYLELYQTHPLGKNWSGMIVTILTLAHREDVDKLLDLSRSAVRADSSNSFLKLILSQDKSRRDLKLHELAFKLQPSMIGPITKILELAHPDDRDQFIQMVLDTRKNETGTQWDRGLIAVLENKNTKRDAQIFQYALELNPDESGFMRDIINHFSKENVLPAMETIKIFTRQLNWEQNQNNINLFNHLINHNMMRGDIELFYKVFEHPIPSETSQKIIAEINAGRKLDRNFIIKTIDASPIEMVGDYYFDTNIAQAIKASGLHQDKPFLKELGETIGVETASMANLRSDYTLKRMEKSHPGKYFKLMAFYYAPEAALEIDRRFLGQDSKMTNELYQLVISLKSNHNLRSHKDLDITATAALIIRNSPSEHIKRNLAYFDTIDKDKTPFKILQLILQSHEIAEIEEKEKIIKQLLSDKNYFKKLFFEREFYFFEIIKHFQPGQRLQFVKDFLNYTQLGHPLARELLIMLVTDPHLNDDMALFKECLRVANEKEKNIFLKKVKAERNKKIALFNKKSKKIIKNRKEMIKALGSWFLNEREEAEIIEQASKLAEEDITFKKILLQLMTASDEDSQWRFTRTNNLLKKRAEKVITKLYGSEMINNAHPYRRIAIPKTEEDPTIREAMLELIAEEEACSAEMRSIISGAVGEIHNIGTIKNH